MRKFVLGLVTLVLALTGLLYFSRDFNPAIADARQIDITQTKVNLISGESGYVCLSETQIKDFYVPTGERFTANNNEECNVLQKADAK